MIEFEEILNQLRAAKQDSNIKFVNVSGERSIQIQELTVQLTLKSNHVNE